MRACDALREIIKRSGTNTAKISAGMGKGRTYLANILVASGRRGGSMSTDTICKIAEICGYDLALIEREAVPEGAVVIRNGDGESR